jgi:hypothetical protein
MEETNKSRAIANDSHQALIENRNYQPVMPAGVNREATPPIGDSGLPAGRNNTQSDPLTPSNSSTPSSNGA